MAFAFRAPTVNCQGKRYYAKAAAPKNAPPPPSYVPPNFSQLLALRLKYGEARPPVAEYAAAKKKYMESLDLKSHIKNYETKLRSNPIKNEIQKFRDALNKDANLVNSKAKYEALCPNLSKIKPWPSKKEVREKIPGILGIKPDSSYEVDLEALSGKIKNVDDFVAQCNIKSVPTPDVWGLWQQAKVEMLDNIQEAYDSVHDFDTFQVDITHRPEWKSLTKDEMIFLPKEYREYAAKPIPDTAEPKFAEEAELLDAEGEEISRNIEIHAGELLNSPERKDFNPFAGYKQ